MTLKETFLNSFSFAVKITVLKGCESNVIQSYYDEYRGTHASPRNSQPINSSENFFCVEFLCF